MFPMAKHQWYEDLSPRVRERLAAFTPNRDGWMRWYRGKTRFVCSHRTHPDAVEDRWQDKKRKIDEDLTTAAKRTIEGVTLRDALSDFYTYLDDCVVNRHPKPMSDYTRADYIRTLTEFAKTIGGGDRLLAEIGPDDFRKFSRTMVGQAPSTLGRNVAYVRAFFAFCVGEGKIPELPQFGRYFIKPHRQEHRDRRIDQRKSYTPEEIRKLWDAADATERTWIALGLNGALDNADLAHFTADVIDWDAETIDYRRRKQGKVRRVIPLRPETIKLLKSYKRPTPQPGNEHLFFVTPKGNPLGRIKESGKRVGLSSGIDYVSQRWRKLLVRAGLREKPQVLESIGRGAKRRRRIKFVGKPDGRGFRSLRTTFANLVPAGYGDERTIIMGHSKGGVLVENYLETLGTARLKECVGHVWKSAFKSPPRRGAKVQGAKRVVASAAP